MTDLALSAAASAGIMPTKLGWADVRIDVDKRYAEWRSSLNAYYQTLERPGGAGKKPGLSVAARQSVCSLCGPPPLNATAEVRDE